VPEADFICPVIAASPFLGKEPVTSEAKSVKLALTCEEEMVAPAEKLLLTVMVPDPLRGMMLPYSISWWTVLTRGMTRNKPTSIYVAWVSMRQRCNNPRCRQFHHYGGRGIRVCERWNSFANFEADMGPKPDNMSLDRIDMDGDYTPENCRWATQTEQMRNLRITRRVMIEGRSYVAADLAERSGLKTDTIIDRASHGLVLAEVLSAERRVFTDGLALGGLANGARQRARTHCKRGHEFTPENTDLTKEGWRQCRTCRGPRALKRHP
jgi:hypothetical protein